jgi:hypothetical protein
VCGEVQADVAGPACAEHVTRAERDPGVIEEEPGRSGEVADNAGSIERRFGVQFQCAAVKPGEVGPLWPGVADGREVFGEQLGEQVAVAIQAG